MSKDGITGGYQGKANQGAPANPPSGGSSGKKDGSRPGMSDRFFKHGDTTVNLDGLRAIHVVKANPCGGTPRSDAGVLTYADGTEIRVSVEFATELTVFLSEKGRQK